MIILNSKKSINEILNMINFTNSFVKGVVDIQKELVALDAEMHYELADYLKLKEDSKEIDMWGFNLWLDNASIEDTLEYDSFINIRNNQLHGYPRGGMDILDLDIKNKATEVICKWIQF